MKPIKYILAAFVAIGLSACKEESSHSHDGDHGHGHASHEGHDHDDGGHDHDDHKHAAAAEHTGHDHDAVDQAEHGHDHAKAVREAGPNGGRVLNNFEPHLEFLVTEDRKVQITALDEELKATAFGTQVVSLVAGDRAAPTRMTFAQDGDHLISNVGFPEGDDFPVVVQVRPSEGAPSVVEKFTMDFSPCPSCKYLEYACTCDHGDGHDHGHKH